MHESVGRKNVVVIGGGTGSHTVLKGLKQHASRINVTAVVSMADSGGSTGRLRDEFGYLPVGDVRMALAALAKDTARHEDLLRQLFLHRFDKGEGLRGHNLGNLLLVALTDLLGSESEAVTAAAEILNLQGVVVPVTADDVHLVATYDDGVVVEGESVIDAPPEDRFTHRITMLGTKPTGYVSSAAAKAILKADLIVIGPGDFYSSLLANIVIEGVPEAIRVSEGKLVFITSLMERPGQTKGMTQSQIFHELCRYIGRCPEVIAVNSASIPEAILARYQAYSTYPIQDDFAALNIPVVRRPLLSNDQTVQAPQDQIERSLIRHDSDKLAELLIELLQ